tara:strand:- start:3292 stop:3534 length:243 start_codon:yes stop_codon:yes gene_type:complete
MKMKNLMHFEVKTHKGKHRNLLAESVVNFLNQERYSVSLNKNVKYADMDLTQFINSIAKDQKELDRLKLNIERLELSEAS